MEPKTGLLKLWISMVVLSLTMPYSSTHGCKEKRIQYTRNKIEGLLHIYRKFNSKLTGWPEEIPELNLNTSVSTNEKRQRENCGVHYMYDALELIYHHQTEIHDTHTIISETQTVLKVLKQTKGCFQNCTNITKPHFPHKNIYNRKQWGLSILEASVNFLDHLKVIKTQDMKARP
ncbi:uncharacterized protein osm [Myxocyprinus asiaticus]|uniref:uncharacterized protein osm n=1 Tax=Myxocyprinus asiaticus TaxID=70543 RepID=UPI0022221868|nr:uncharacterized protein osm [Myxocyprinus asiaticus]